VALGFSQGGLMAIDLAFRETAAFAGLVVLSSWFPEVLAANLPQTPAQRGFPVLMIHGSQDRQASVAQARESRAVFERFGVDLSFHELPMGHEVTAEALGILVRWLREKVRI
jgi:phospholipase/carboxylesterase